MAGTTWFHLTATLSRELPSLCREDVGMRLWPELREAFSAAIVGLLMPDHPHVVIATSRPEASVARLDAVLARLVRRHGLGPSAYRVAEPKPIRGGDVLARHVRYVVLNPCRAKLASCPIAWPWSTHRDVVGACVDPWVGAQRLAAALGCTGDGFAAWHHAYVSADPSTHVGGTPMPAAARPSALSSVGLRAIALAVAAATRSPVDAIRRRGPVRALFIALAYEHGWDHPEKLAEVCRCRPRLVRELVPRVEAHALDAARLCLGDARLQQLPPRIEDEDAERTKRSRSAGPQRDIEHADGARAQQRPSRVGRIEDMRGE